MWANYFVGQIVCLRSKNGQEIDAVGLDDNEFLLALSDIRRLRGASFWMRLEH